MHQGTYAAITTGAIPYAEVNDLQAEHGQSGRIGRQSPPDAVSVAYRESGNVRIPLFT